MLKFVAGLIVGVVLGVYVVTSFPREYEEFIATTSLEDVLR